MPRTAQAAVSCLTDPAPSLNRAAGDALAPPERALLLHLQVQALRYFLDNQRPCGLVLDRQHNHGPERAHGLCSLAATGMGFVALALASAPPYRLLPAQEAAERLRAGLRGVLERLPHEHGVVPHFVDSASGAVRGVDVHSTVETAWVVAGALWAAAFLQDGDAEEMAGRLYDRIDWAYWAAPGSGLIRHGIGRDGQFLPCCWDRVNGETAFMYVLAAGADDGRALPGTSWAALRPFFGVAGGLRFHSADLGLFVFQYGLDLLDLRRWRAPGEVDLWAEASLAARANERACREAADAFRTYRRFWGLSAGDGPPAEGEGDVYRCYSPAGPIDGTAHLTATLASVVHSPEAILHNLYEADRDEGLGAHGRYGFSSVNLDRSWVARDMVGIDAGAAVLALDNFLMADRVRDVFHSLPCVRRGLGRIGFTPRPEAAPPVRLVS